MSKITNMLIIILTIILSLTINITVLANSSNNNNKLEKVKIKSIEDYYDYINKVGAVKAKNNIGPDKAINSDNNANNNQDNYSVINTAVASIKNNDIIDGQLVSNGNNIRFTYIDNQGKHYLKGWAALNMATGQKGWYHFDLKGNMTTGFYTERDNTYYFIESGNNMGMMATGTLDINGKIYQFSTIEGNNYGILIQ